MLTTPEAADCRVARQAPCFPSRMSLAPAAVARHSLAAAADRNRVAAGHSLAAVVVRSLGAGCSWVVGHTPAVAHSSATDRIPAVAHPQAAGRSWAAVAHTQVAADHSRAAA